LVGLGRRESLTGEEVNQFHFNIQTNHLVISLATSFSEVTDSNKVRNYVLRGKDVALKHINVFSDYLRKIIHFQYRCLLITKLLIHRKVTYKYALSPNRTLAGLAIRGNVGVINEIGGFI
jgi:hypothetical protein